MAAQNAGDVRSVPIVSARGARAIGSLKERRELVIVFAMLIAALAFGRMPGAVAGLGALAGAMLAVHAIGMLLIYQTDRIINFAQVQIGAVGATFFVIFARYGPVIELVRQVCPSCIERVTPAMYRWNYVIAAIVGVGVSAILGWLTATVLVRRFASASRLVTTVATLFLVPVLGLAQRAMAAGMVTDRQRELTSGAVILGAPFFPWTFSFRWGPAVFGIPQLVAAFVAVVAIAGVWVFLSRTTSGTSLRAVADAPDRASTLGLDVARIKSRAWMITGALSGAVAVTLAITAGAGEAGALGVSTTVRILAVAVIARMGSLSIAVFAAITLGISENALDWRFDAASLLDGLLLPLIAAVLVVQHRTVTRAERLREASWRFGREVRPVPPELRAHPSVRAWARGIVIPLSAFLLAFPWIMSPSEVSLGTVALLAALVGLSLLVLTGWAGQISLGQMAFAAIGAYIAAVMPLPFPFAVLAAALAGAIAALLIGLPALRLRGMHLAVVTLALSLTVSSLLLDERRLGRFLPSTIRRPRFLSLRRDEAFYYLALAVLTVAVIAVMGLRRSRFARVLIAARDNDQAAESYGVAVVRARLAAFAISGFLAATAGGLLTFQQYGVRGATYSAEQSLYAFLWAVIGGLGAIAGPLLGAAARGVVDIFSNNQIVQFLAGGVGGMLLLVMVPGGLARVVFDIRDGLLRRLAQRDHIVVPSLLADIRIDGGSRSEIAPLESGARVPQQYRLDGQWAIAPDPVPERVRG